MVIEDYYFELIGQVKRMYKTEAHRYGGIAKSEHVQMHAAETFQASGQIFWRRIVSSMYHKL